MKILIIRHAEPDYENNTLTDKGFVEADYLSERLEHSNITHIYSSIVNTLEFIVHFLYISSMKKVLFL